MRQQRFVPSPLVLRLSLPQGRDWFSILNLYFSHRENQALIHTHCRGAMSGRNPLPPVPQCSAEKRESLFLEQTTLLCVPVAQEGLVLLAELLIPDTPPEN